MALPSLLAVFAHPDDESLSAGGLLARHAASGARTTVVTATWAAGTARTSSSPTTITAAPPVTRTIAGRTRSPCAPCARRPTGGSTRGAGDPWRPCRLRLATHPHSARPMLTEIIGARKAVHTVRDEKATALDVTPWMAQKVAAILAHRTEVRRGALPGLVADLPDHARHRLLATEWYEDRTVPPG